MLTAATLLALIPALVGSPLPEAHPLMARARSAAADLLSLGESELMTRIAWSFSYHESGFTTAAIGDGGLSLGVLQTGSAAIEACASTRGKVLASRVEGFRVGICYMKLMIAKCGSVTKGLGAYASGTCQDLLLVAHRCKKAGLTSRCELK